MGRQFDESGHEPPPAADDVKGSPRGKKPEILIEDGIKGPHFQ